MPTEAARNFYERAKRAAVFPTRRRVSAKARAFVAFIEGVLAPPDEPC